MSVQTQHFAVCTSPKYGGQKYTNIPYVNGDVQRVQHIVYGTGSDHQPGIDGAAHNSSQRIPRSLIKPVQEVVETVLHHVGRRSVVEPETRKRSIRKLICAPNAKSIATNHGSNSCMMLSNRMTANSRAENPDTHAKKRMANVMRLFHPAGLVSSVFILT